MSSAEEIWPGGLPEVGQKAQRSRQVTARDIELQARVLLDDGTVVLEGDAVCYAMPIGQENSE